MDRMDKLERVVKGIRVDLLGLQGGLHMVAQRQDEAKEALDSLAAAAKAASDAAASVTEAVQTVNTRVDLLVERFDEFAELVVTEIRDMHALQARVEAIERKLAG